MPKEEPKKTLTFEELAMSNMWQLETLTRLLIKKGIFTKEEYSDEFSELKKEYDKENQND